jgi:hypothetical protein
MINILFIAAKNIAVPVKIKSGCSFEDGFVVRI